MFVKWVFVQIKENPWKIPGKVFIVNARNEKKQIAKFQFSLKNAELNKQWIPFVNRRDLLVTKHSVLCELSFEEIYLRRGEKCTVVDESSTHGLSSNTFK